MKVEADDLHIALQDATGDKPGIVVVEMQAKPQWCSIRETVFSWTQTRFPFHTSSAKKLNVTNPPIITVVGKAFFDIGHSLKDQSQNRRKNLPGYAACEIHPVMALHVDEQIALPTCHRFFVGSRPRKVRGQIADCRFFVRSFS